MDWGEWLIGLLQPGEEAEWLNAVNDLRRSLDGPGEHELNCRKQEADYVDGFDDWLCFNDGERYSALFEEFLDSGGRPGEDGGFFEWAKSKYIAEMSQTGESKH